uniref:Uncharacterized protein n=1 Tax=Symphyocladiella dendroidea TaxID=2506487 RepID=A0A1Z1M7H0_9FLOR|nr:hypothetical protein [Symphyocladiella dendroidea]ARW61781.1 hypothetical protein [Symphyocladiella dendroidea]
MFILYDLLFLIITLVSIDKIFIIFLLILNLNCIDFRFFIY